MTSLPAEQHAGIGAAAGVVLMIILILVTLLDFKGLERKVHYQ